MRTKDAMVLHQAPELFISMMLADGVFMRHPKLKGACVELGAGWVPEMLRRLDMVAKAFSKFDASIRMDRKPGEQIIEQMVFTPMPSEDVGNMIEQSCSELFVFSSDYPHLEGTRDPIARFERTMSSLNADQLDHFYSDNFKRAFSLT